MKLNNYNELQKLIENIGFLVDDESEDFITSIYYYILYNYGNKSVAPILESGVNTETIAKIINNKYAKLWEKAKTINDTDISLNEFKRIEKTDNEIFGYNSDVGVNDYSTTKTYTNDIENIFDNYINALDFFGNNIYYGIIASCIVNEITLPLYESEV